MRKFRGPEARAGAAPSRRAGMTLVELLIAVAVFLILLSMIVPAMLTTAALNTRNDQVSVAVRLATVTLENYRAQMGSAVVTLPSSGTVTTTSTVNGRSYSVAALFCPTDVPTGMACGLKARYIRVTVTNAGSVPLYTAESFFTELK